MSLSMNLQSDGVVGAASGSFSAPIQIVDSLGTTHTLTVNFTKTGANAWNYEVDIPGQDLTAGTAGTPSSLATGSLTFDSNGNLTTPAAPGQVPVAITGLADGASDINLNWNLYDTNNVPTMTQFAQPSALSATSQNGVAAAEITQVSLGGWRCDRRTLFRRQPADCGTDRAGNHQQPRVSHFSWAKQL